MILYYVHDPMCSWCWGFSKVWLELKRLIAKSGLPVEIIQVVGGLAPDSDEPMPEKLQEYLKHTWQNIQQKIPGTQFNYDFWIKCQPRRSTYPACRAILAARSLDITRENAMIEGIQLAYYVKAKNPSINKTLIEIAIDIGLDGNEFERELLSVGINKQLDKEIQFARSIGANSFPSLFLKNNGRINSINLDYNSASIMYQQINK